MQMPLGDDPDTARARKRAELEERTHDILQMLEPDGPSKPKHALHFFEEIPYKFVGGQQLTATCMFCQHGPIASTGAARASCSICCSAGLARRR